MKAFSTLLAAACLASVQAHTMLVCTATSCNTPGRVTIFLGTYHNEPRNPNAPQSPGGVTVTTMSGDNYDFPFAATCEGYSDLKGSDDFSTLKKSFMAHNQDAQPSGSGVITNSCRSQGETNPAAGGKPIIDDDSIITCFNGDKNVDGSSATTLAGVPMAAEWTTSGQTFCAYHNSPCHGFYYMVMDNVLPGDYTIQGWTTDQILASGSNAGVCGVIGYGSYEQSAKSASKEYAFSLSVATQQCSAGTGARCSAPSAEQFGAGLALSTTEVCDKEGGAMPGYMCSAKCKSGYTQGTRAGMSVPLISFQNRLLASTLLSYVIASVWSRLVLSCLPPPTRSHPHSSLNTLALFLTFSAPLPTYIPTFLISPPSSPSVYPSFRLRRPTHSRDNDLRSGRGVGRLPMRCG